MTLVLALALPLLAGASGDCYVVTNTRIVVLPTCVGPATIASLTERPASQRPQPPGFQRSNRATRRTGRVVTRAPAPQLDARHVELERRLEAEQQRRITAVAQRLAAERARDEAIRARDEALRQAAVAQRALAEARRGAEAGEGTRVTLGP